MNRILLFLFLFNAFNLNAQKTLPLYTDNIPNSKPNSIEEITLKNDDQLFGYKNISIPTVTVYLPQKNKRKTEAVIICPGGGYGMESFQLEGIKIAETFLNEGIAAIILKYRLPNELIMVDKSIGPIQDAQQAIKIVREHAKKWNIDPNKIGIMGFSAGGHLASTAGTHFNKSYISNTKKTNLRPDFMILVYPVISMRSELGHSGSRNNLLGKHPSEEQILLFSNELQVQADTPPTWITHTGDDTVVSVENSIQFYQALVKNNVDAEMHLFPTGNHGFVLNQPTTTWMQPLFDWIEKLD